MYVKACCMTARRQGHQLAASEHAQNCSLMRDKHSEPWEIVCFGMEHCDCILASLICIAMAPDPHVSNKNEHVMKGSTE